jgi:hypothetical protein
MIPPAMGAAPLVRSSIERTDPPQRSGGAARAAVLAAVTLLAFPAGTLLFAALGFVLGFRVSPLDLAAGVVSAAAVALGASARRGGLRAAARGAAVFAGCSAVVGAALLLAPWRYDVSWDGQSYHQQSVIALARGWNPLGPPLTAADFTMHGHVNNMAKGSWVVEAALYRFTGSIETAKALNLVLMAAALCAALSALLALPRLGRAAAVACAGLAALNPVAFTQLFTFYVDGGVASLIAAFAALAYVAVERRDRLALFGMALATVLLANAKLTGVPYAVLLWAGAIAAALLRRGAREGATLGAVAAAALAVAVLGPGWNPYVTNTLRHGHPFYPAAGPHAQDFVSSSRPEAFAPMNRLERLARATFSVTSNEIERGARLKPPFTIRWEEGGACAGCETRLAGLGPLFSGALVLAVIAAALGRRRASVAAALVAAALVGTTLATAEGWWARFAPQLWLVPIVLALPALAAPRRPGARLAGVLVLAVLAADAGLVIVNNLNRFGRTDHELRRQLAALAATPGTMEVRFDKFESAGVRLTEAGIRWRSVERLGCAAPEPLVGSFLVRLCPPSEEPPTAR